MFWVLSFEFWSLKSELFVTVSLGEDATFGMPETGLAIIPGYVIKPVIRLESEEVHPYFSLNRTVSLKVCALKRSMIPVKVLSEFTDQNLLVVGAIFTLLFTKKTPIHLVRHDHYT